MKKIDDRQRDLFRSREVRDEGMARVEANSEDWGERAFSILLDLKRRIPEGTATGEDIRYVIAGEIGNPPHHNAWGALINQGRLLKTGKYAQMRDIRSHARSTPVYEIR